MKKIRPRIIVCPSPVLQKLTSSADRPIAVIGVAKFGNVSSVPSSGTYTETRAKIAAHHFLHPLIGSTVVKHLTESTKKVVSVVAGTRGRKGSQGGIEAYKQEGRVDHTPLANTQHTCPSLGIQNISMFG